MPRSESNFNNENSSSSSSNNLVGNLGNRNNRNILNNLFPLEKKSMREVRFSSTFHLLVPHRDSSYIFVRERPGYKGGQGGKGLRFARDHGIVPNYKVVDKKRLTYRIKRGIPVSQYLKTIKKNQKVAVLMAVRALRRLIARLKSSGVLYTDLSIDRIWLYSNARGGLDAFLPVFDARFACKHLPLSLGYEILSEQVDIAIRKVISKQRAFRFY